MPTFREALAEGIREGYCFLSPQLNTALLVGLFVGAGPVGTSLAIGANTALTRLNCNREPPPPVYTAGSAFNGGQCPVRYRVTVRYVPSSGTWFSGPDAGTQNERVAAREVIGPVAPLRVEVLPGTADPRFDLWSIRGRVSARTQTATAPANATIDIEYIDRQAVTPKTGTIKITNVLVERLDNLADNCGNPERTLEPPPPNSNRYETNTTYNDVNGNQITIPTVFVFSPFFVTAKGELQLPVTVTLSPDVTFSGNLDIGTGDFNFDFRFEFTDSNGDRQQFPPGDSSGDNRPDNYTNPNTIPPPPSGEEFEDTEEPEEPAKELTIRGVGVTVQGGIPSTLGVIFQNGGNPDIITPDLGFVQFQIRLGQSTFWTNAIKVNNERAFIPCPWVGGAIDVRGSPRPGVSWQLTPAFQIAELQRIIPGAG